MAPMGELLTPSPPHPLTPLFLILLIFGSLAACRPDPPAAALQKLIQQPDAEARARLAERIALEPLSTKTELLGHRIAAVGLTGDYWTVGRRPAAVVFSNDESSPMIPTLVLACGGSMKGPAMKVTVEDGQKTSTVDFSTGAVQQIILQPVAPHTRRLYVITASRSWRPGPHDPRPLGVRVGVPLTGQLLSLQRAPRARRTKRVLRLMAHEPFHGKGRLLGDRVVSVGLNLDRWTDSGRVAGVVVDNRGRKPWSPELLLTCDARPAELPVTVTLLTAGTNVRQYFFHRRGKRRVALPAVQPGEQRLTTVAADRVRVLPTTERKRRGVRLSLSTPGLLRQLLASPGDGHYRSALAERVWSRALPRVRDIKKMPARALELTPDGWTSDGNPGALVITNRGHAAARWKLVLGCDAPPRSLPLTAVVDDGEKQREVPFSQPGEVTLPLAPVRSFTRRLVVVSTKDRWWTPGTATDSRKLGVRLKLVRAGK